jgi:hypothetical protein
MRRCAYDLDFLISRQPKPVNAKVNAITPARTPAPNELEYLDVFDFFNMPRLPFSAGTDSALGATAGNGNGSAGAAGGEYQGLEGMIGNNEFNITNFMYDANSDWFVKNTGQ